MTVVRLLGSAACRCARPSAVRFRSAVRVEPKARPVLGRRRRPKLRWAQAFGLHLAVRRFTRQTRARLRATRSALRVWSCQKKCASIRLPSLAARARPNESEDRRHRRWERFSGSSSMPAVGACADSPASASSRWPDRAL